MSQGRGFDLKYVVCHVLGRDASLRRMCASHSLPMEASTDSRREKYAIAIAERQWTKCVRRSNNPSIVIDVSYSQQNALERYLLPTGTCKH